MMQQQQTYFLELYRAGMRTASDIMKASLENAQKLHSQQMEVVRGAIEENARSARDLSEVKSFDEMMALQTRMAGAQLERAADFWSRLWRVAGEGQVAMIGQVQNQVGQLSERVRETYQMSARSAEQFAARGAERGAEEAARFAASASEAAQAVSRKEQGQRRSA